MKKNTVRLFPGFAVVMLAAAVFVLAACGDSSSGDNTAPPAAATAEYQSYSAKTSDGKDLLVKIAAKAADASLYAAATGDHYKVYLKGVLIDEGTVTVEANGTIQCTPASPPSSVPDAKFTISQNGANITIGKITVTIPSPEYTPGTPVEIDASKPITTGGGGAATLADLLGTWIINDHQTMIIPDPNSTSATSPTSTTFEDTNTDKWPPEMGFTYVATGIVKLNPDGSFTIVHQLSTQIEPIDTPYFDPNTGRYVTHRLVGQTPDNDPDVTVTLSADKKTMLYNGQAVATKQ